MKTAAEYRAMAEECFRWARQARTSEMRVSLRQLAHIWLDTASNLDGLPPTRTQPPPENRKASWQWRRRSQVGSRRVSASCQSYQASYQAS